MGVCTSAHMYMYIYIYVYIYIYMYIEIYMSIHKQKANMYKMYCDVFNGHAPKLLENSHCMGRSRTLMTSDPTKNATNHKRILATQLPKCILL